MKELRTEIEIAAGAERVWTPGAPIGPRHMRPYILVPAVLLLPAALLGWLGIR